jgi:hypothetical protein
MAENGRRMADILDEKMRWEIDDEEVRKATKVRIRQETII